MAERSATTRGEGDGGAAGALKRAPAGAHKKEIPPDEVSAKRSCGEEPWRSAAQTRADEATEEPRERIQKRVIPMMQDGTN